jgi:hypothetical protein
MHVNSHHIEFGYELLSAVPYAYELHLQGKLKGTISGVDTSPLYYFSPDHKELKKQRGFFNIKPARDAGLPHTHIHTHERPDLKFPPYKEQFKNDIYKWGKPTVVIANRYTKEWNREPINYFDSITLDSLFTLLKKEYEIVYIAAEVPKEMQDKDQRDLGLNDRGVAEKHGVKVFQDIKGDSWNLSLLQVFANCDRFITMNGGYSILASLFGGENIIYSEENTVPHTKELEKGSFWRWYPNHSDQRVWFCGSKEKLIEAVDTLWVKKLPTVNIIVRTSKRPNAYNRCIRSIYEQDYPNINIVTITDEQEGVSYSRPVRGRHIHCTYHGKGQQPEGKEYGRSFPFNRYLDMVQRRVKGYLLFLDDDNMLIAKNAISTIVDNMTEDTLLVWRCQFGDGRVLPSESFGKEIKLYDIDTACFMYHSNHVDKSDWSQWKRADFRTAFKLNRYLCTRWMDVILTRQQMGSGFGRQVDIIKTRKGMKTVRILKPEVGKVGTVKRLDDRIAKEQVELGNVEYLSDVVEQLNTVGKPVVVENKVLNVEAENKDDGTTTTGNKRGQAAKPRASKKVRKAE